MGRESILARVRPAEGWLVFSLVLIGTSALPLSIVEAKWAPGADGLLLVALLATYVGARMGTSSLHARWSVPAGLLAGTVLLASAAGRIWPPLNSLLRELSRSGAWLSNVLRGQRDSQIPFLSLTPGMRARALAFVARLAGWVQIGVEGGVSKDNVVLVFFLSVAVWILCWFAGWHLCRYGRTLWAMLPCGAALVSNVAFTGRGEWPLRIYLASTLLLLAWAGFRQREKRWDQEGIDYSDELRRDVALVGAAIATVILAAALMIPFVTSHKGIEFFWRYLGEPWQRVEHTMDRLFAGRYRIPPRASETRPGGHTLGGTVQVSEELVMYVATSDPSPPIPEENVPWPGEDAIVPQRYWRRLTYDRYTGQGWENSAEEGREGDAGEPLTPRIQSSELVTQAYHLASPGGEESLGYAINEPYVIERPHTLHLRAEDDISGFSLKEQVFGVVSQVPRPTVQQLRVVSPPYPSELHKRYTRLPRLPRRVSRLAQEITAGVDNAFDMATVIETYLRSFDYTLDIAAPPPGRDGVDYFLFDLRKGYCDYFATAMVVLCRSVGIPARYATGYAMGSYDHNRTAWVVREENAHAWVEIHFDGYGWVEFEPTPARYPFTRLMRMPSGEIALSRVQVTPESIPEIDRWSEWHVWLVLVVAFLLGAAAVSIWRRHLVPTTTKQPGERVQRLYALVAQWATWAGMAPRPAQTPTEFLSSLGERLEADRSSAVAVRRELAQIGQTYVAERYAPHAVPEADALLAEDAWRRLRSVLWRAAALHKARFA